VYDFGALEIQAVYISGNVREPFEHFMKDPRRRASMDWSKEPNYPRPDYLSFAQERLVPQLLCRSGILHSWGKKSAVALNRGFFDTLPKLQEVSKGEADIAWMVYDVVPGANRNGQASRQMELVLRTMVYTKWPDFLKAERIPIAEDIGAFLRRIDAMLDDLAV